MTFTLLKVAVNIYSDGKYVPLTYGSLQCLEVRKKIQPRTGNWCSTWGLVSGPQGPVWQLIQVELLTGIYHKNWIPDWRYSGNESLSRTISSLPFLLKINLKLFFMLC